MSGPAARPRWLEWAQTLQTIAHAGLMYSKDPFDLERFQQLQDLAAEVLASHTDGDVATMRDALRADAGYVTPKVDVRAVVFDGERILLVREATDGGWSLPGGWADIGRSAAEIAATIVIS